MPTDKDEDADQVSLHEKQYGDVARALPIRRNAVKEKNRRYTISDPEIAQKELKSEWRVLPKKLSIATVTDPRAQKKPTTAKIKIAERTPTFDDIIGNDAPLPKSKGFRGFFKGIVRSDKDGKGTENHSRARELY